MAVLCEGRIKDRLHAVFELTDRDNSGRLSRHELLRFFESISARPVDSGRVETFVNRLMHAVDGANRPESTRPRT